MSSSDFFWSVVIIGGVILIALASASTAPKYRVIRTGDTYTVQTLNGVIYSTDCTTTNRDEAIKAFNKEKLNGHFEVITNAYAQ